MWALGASAVYLATPDGLFRANGEDAKLSEIVTCMGQPPDDVLDIGLLTSRYFCKQKNKGKRWRLNSPLDFEEETGREARTTESIRLEGIPELILTLHQVDQEDGTMLPLPPPATCPHHRKHAKEGTRRVPPTNAQSEGPESLNCCLMS